MADAQKCINLSPGWAKGYGRRAAALVGLGRVPQAIDSYRQAMPYPRPRLAPWRCEGCRSARDRHSLTMTSGSVN